MPYLHVCPASNMCIVMSDAMLLRGLEYIHIAIAIIIPRKLSYYTYSHLNYQPNADRSRSSTASTSISAVGIPFYSGDWARGQTTSSTFMKSSSATSDVSALNETEIMNVSQQSHIILEPPVQFTKRRTKEGKSLGLECR